MRSLVTPKPRQAARREVARQVDEASISLESERMPHCCDASYDGVSATRTCTERRRTSVVNDVRSGSVSLLILVANPFRRCRGQPGLFQWFYHQRNQLRKPLSRRKRMS